MNIFQEYVSFAKAKLKITDESVKLENLETNGDVIIIRLTNGMSTSFNADELNDQYQSADDRSPEPETDNNPGANGSTGTSNDGGANQASATGSKRTSTREDRSKNGGTSIASETSTSREKTQSKTSSPDLQRIIKEAFDALLEVQADTRRVLNNVVRAQQQALGTQGTTQPGSKEPEGSGSSGMQEKEKEDSNPRSQQNPGTGQDKTNDNRTFEQNLEHAREIRDLRNLVQQELSKTKEREVSFESIFNKIESILNKNLESGSAGSALNDQSNNREIGALVEKDTSKLEYLLTRKKHFKLWHSLLETELGLKRLSDVIDDDIPPPKPFSNNEMEERKRIAKGIILSHVDESYQEIIIELRDPKEIIQKLKEIKKNEINDTTVSVKKQIANLKFNFGVEACHDFNMKFDELIRKYEVVSGVPMTENDKRDYYYRIVAKVIPSIKDATYADRARGIGDGYNFIQLRKYVQQFEAENRPSLQEKDKKGVMYTNDNNNRCYNCSNMGHSSKHCPVPVGQVYCYRCKKYAVHKAHECRESGTNYRGVAKRPHNSRGGYRSTRGRFDERQSGRGRYKKYFRSNRGGNSRGKSNETFNNKKNFDREFDNTRGRNFGGRNKSRGSNRGGFNRHNPEKCRENPNNINYRENDRNKTSRTGIDCRDGADRTGESKPENQINFVTPAAPALESDAWDYRNGPKEVFYVYREEQWWTHKIARDASEFFERQEEVERTVERLKAAGVFPKLVRPEDDIGYEGENPNNILKHLKKDDDDSPGADGCFMAGNSSGNTSCGNRYISLIADSGASDHMIKDLSAISNFKTTDDSIKSANVSSEADLKIKGTGDVFVLSNGSVQKPFKFSNVKFSPNVSENLCSLRKFTEAGFEIVLNCREIKIIDPINKEIFVTGHYSNPVWIIKLQLLPESECKNIETCSKTESTNVFQTMTLENDNLNNKISTECKDSGGGLSTNETQKFTTTNVSVASNHKAVDLDIPKNNLDDSHVEKLTPIDVELDLPMLIKEKDIDVCQLREDEGMMWHRRLGHPSLTYLLQLQKSENCLNKVKFTESILKCDICAVAKMSKLPFTQVRSRAFRPLQIIHSDLMGPIKPTTFPGKNRFIVVFIDDFSRFAMAYAMEHKHETGIYLEKFITSARNMIGKDEKICYFRSDKGTEFTGGLTQEILEREKIESQFAPPDTPEHNGVAERFNRTLSEKIRVLLFDSGLPHSFWDIAMRVAVFTYNRTPHRSNNFKTPIKCFAPHISINTSQIKRFGCLAYMKVPRANQQPKMAKKALRTVLIGYLTDGYQLYHIQSKKFLESRHVRFNEHIVYKQIIKNTAEEEMFECPIYLSENSETVISENSPLSQSKSERLRKRKEEESTTLTLEEENSVKKSKISNKNDVCNKDLSKENLKNQFEKRTIQDNSFVGLIDNEDIKSRIIFGTYEEELNEIHDLEVDEVKYRVLANINKEPSSYKEAMECRESKQWHAAVKEELHSMSKNQVWHYVDRPTKQNVIDSRWVLKRKEEKFKARLVVRGFKDLNEYDLRETYALVARLPVVRTILAIINYYNLDAIQLDVKTAFLNGTIEEEIYMEIPDGVECSQNFKERKVCKLNKALYGLRISPKRWNVRFTEVVTQLGLVPCKDEPCLFVWRRNSKLAILLLYVDDMLIASNQKEKLSDIRSHLMTTFEMTDLGTPRKFLGLEIFRNREDKILRITQTEYIHKILERFKMGECKTHNTPMVTKGNEPKLTVFERGNQNKVPYREAIGSLLYLAGSCRPDIAFAVNVLSRKQTNPTEGDWAGVKRVFRYLKGTSSLGLTFVAGNDDLVLYTDASFMNCERSQSTSGYILKFFGNTICWRSHKQSFVAMSICEAEFISMLEGCREAIAISKVLYHILEKTYYPIRLWCDNLGSIDCIKKDVNNVLRHVVVRHADYVKLCDEAGQISAKWIESGEQLADILTKALPAKSHIKLTNCILNSNVPNP